MTTVHRNGTPPRQMPYKLVQVFSDMEFNEELITKWAREHLQSPMQYDIAVFNGTKGKLNRTVEFTAWFKSKVDAERFRVAWMS